MLPVFVRRLRRRTMLRILGGFIFSLWVSLVYLFMGIVFSSPIWLPWVVGHFFGFWAGLTAFICLLVVFGSITDENKEAMRRRGIIPF